MEREARVHILFMFYFKQWSCFKCKLMCKKEIHLKKMTRDNKSESPLVLQPEQDSYRTS